LFVIVVFLLGVVLLDVVVVIGLEHYFLKDV